MTKEDERRVTKAVQGLQYPASKRQVVDYVRERGGDEKTVRAVQELPEGTYHDSEQIEDAVPHKP